MSSKFSNETETELTQSTITKFIAFVMFQSLKLPTRRNECITYIFRLGNLNFNNERHISGEKQALENTLGNNLSQV